LNGPLEKKIDSTVQLDMELSTAPGAMVLVKRDGVKLFEKAYGLRNARSREPVTPSTLFLTASVTKTITTAALLTVCSRKDISTDTPIGEILTDLPDEIAELSLDQILSQSSGILDHWPTRKKWKNDPKAYFTHFGNRLLSHELQGVFSYTNFGHVLAGMALAELHGKPFETSVREILLLPLGMDHTTYQVTEEKWMNHAAAHDNGKVVRHEYTFPMIQSSASMFSTAEDLTRFASCLMNQGEFQGIQVIPEEVIRMMPGKYTPVGVLHNYFGYPGSYYGYGLMSFDYKNISFVGHPGETTTQNLLFAMAPDQKTSFVIMSNTGLYPFINTFETLCRAFLEIDSSQKAGVKENHTLQFDPKEYTGTFYVPSISSDRSQAIKVYRKNGNLFLSLSEEENYRLTWLGKDLFSYSSPRFKFKVEVRFFRDDTGYVRYLNHYWKTAVKSRV
jgi:CubicO group peptidase (beta-lactamase class C family)